VAEATCLETTEEREGKKHALFPLLMLGLAPIAF